MSLPQHMRADDPAAADPARRRLLHKSTFPRFPSFPSTTPIPVPNTIPHLSNDTPTDDIIIGDARLSPLQDDKDVYRWAILYENQRGITLFSTPFYSPLSLLPSDPQPFTLPHSYNARVRHQNLSLHNYPLPDGTWRWVSGAWMIDMRSDLGEVQHDGFEYNRSFRDSHWHPKIGKLGAGAWVRRRRWVRLMMRPANHTCSLQRTLISSSPSLEDSPSKHSESNPQTSHIWAGDEQDWHYVHRLLSQLGRDGRKLELWRMWLTPYAQMLTPDSKGKAKQSHSLPTSSQHALQNRLSNIVLKENPPSLAHLTTILKNHGEAILHTFVFPDSRAQFVDLLGRTGLAKDLESCLGRTFSAADVDFFSYANNLGSLSDGDRS